MAQDMIRKLQVEINRRSCYMIISEITINEAREIDSIKLKINDSLVDYIRKEEGVSIEGTPSSFYVTKHWNKYIKFRYCNINIIGIIML